MIDYVIINESLEVCYHLVNYYCLIIQLNSQIQMQRPDHPHQAAVHLMRALKCCNDCNETSEKDLLQIRQLKYKKQLLVQELKSLNYKSQSVMRLKEEIREIEILILQLRNQNVQVQNIGFQQISKMQTDRQIFENQQRQGLLAELNSQKNLTCELTLELQSLLERIRYLNRINNELVYNISSY